MNFIKIKTLNSFAYKFVHTALQSNKFCEMIPKKTYKILPRRHTVLRPRKAIIERQIFTLSTALAFLWPIKKQKDITGNISTSNVQGAILETADSLFESGLYEQCYDLLKECEHDNNVEVQWRLCRVLYHMSKELKYDDSYKQTLMLDAYEIILKQLERNDHHYAVHKWYAVLLDAKSSLLGAKERIKQLTTVKKHMDMAVALYPNDATVFYMLGEWCFQITELPWHQRKIAEVLFASPPQSTYEDALEYFLKAESIQPRFYSLNLLRIGICYFRLKKEDQAKYYLQLAASYPAKSNDDHTANKQATEFLKKIK